MVPLKSIANSSKLLDQAAHNVSVMFRGAPATNSIAEAGQHSVTCTKEFLPKSTMASASKRNVSSHKVMLLDVHIVDVVVTDLAVAATVTL
mmetsp:Transcript_115824/g.322064  ORF Transcript_115824/g.322064 Transcript_115824/m.322064 type:complete len:91 (-) Transcript_115824:206-478(-)